MEVRKNYKIFVLSVLEKLVWLKNDEKIVQF